MTPSIQVASLVIGAVRSDSGPLVVFCVSMGVLLVAVFTATSDRTSRRRTGLSLPPTPSGTAPRSLPVRPATPGPTRWPSHLEYVSAVANPTTSFTVLSLAKLIPRSHDYNGNPALISGQNAVVFLVDIEKNPAVLRCMLREQPGSRERYIRLASLPSKPTCLVEAHWLEGGVEIRGRRWPVVTMELVQGVELDEALDVRVGDGAALRDLGRRISSALRALQAVPMAHGDLQHGNVLVQPDGSVRLIDYDGVWLPGITQPPNEAGHPCYQHPSRSVAHWGPGMDSFSALLIWLSVYAVAADATLWDRFHVEGENLIFTSEDLAHPYGTDVWKALYKSPDDEVVRIAEHLAGFCQQPEPPSAVDGIFDLAWWEQGRPEWPETHTSSGAAFGTGSP
jgi:hypothetical protein